MDLENKLTNSESPYLRAHAKNPVNWYPWGDEAIQFARTHDKPIMLSIGYSSCHWCHVMEQESFSNQETAATLNRLFVNILVDKEERPDLDKIYQTCYQLLMGAPGGWPLTLFLSPYTLIPYYGGTYFAKEEQEDMPGFNKLLHGLNDIFYHQKDKIAQQELHTTAILQIINQPRPASETPIAKELYESAYEALEEQYDPKEGGFGTGTKFPVAPTLDFILDSQEPLINHMTIATLEIMSKREIYDKTNGGFYRYATDRAWQKPHREKMLYDNVQLLEIYAKAFALTNNKKFEKISLSIGEWVLNTLADSKTPALFGSVDSDSMQVDTKVIASINGLAIKAFARAGKILGNSKFVVKAQEIAHFLHEHGKYVFLDDYAFVLYGTLLLEDKSLEKACRQLSLNMIDKFYDQTSGGFFFTPKDQDIILYRPKLYMDEAIPSGNSYACLSLLMLQEYEIVRKTLADSQAFINESPELHVNMLRVYAKYHDSGTLSNDKN